MGAKSDEPAPPVKEAPPPWGTIISINEVDPAPGVTPVLDALA